MSDQLAADLASLRIDRAPKPPRQGLRSIVGVMLVGCALAGGVMVAKPRVEARIFKMEVRVTEIASVSPAHADVDITATGYVIAQATAKVSAKIVGRVSQVAVQEGARVEAGAPLFELDPADQNAAIAAGQARAAAASARIATARANAAEVELEHTRQKKLAATGAAARAEAENLEARLKASLAAVVAAEADARAARAEVVSLSTGAKNFRIVAPIGGTAVSKPASVGDVASPGQLLVELADFDTMLVEVDVPEGRLGKVRKDAPCEIVLDAFASDRFQGQVVETAPRLNRAKATALVKVKFLDPPSELRPEMSARVSFLQKALDVAKLKAPEKLVVPAAALIDRGGGKAVWVVEGGRVRLTPVELGEAFGVGFVVERGPPAKTRVVKDPPEGLEEGMAVKESGAS